MNKVHFVIEPAHEHLAYVPPTRTYCMVLRARLLIVWSSCWPDILRYCL